MLLTLLIPNQIVKQWDSIKKAIMESLPPTADRSEEAMIEVLSSAINGKIQIWVLYEPNVEDDSSVIKAIGVTSIQPDPISGTKTLLIYALYGIGSKIPQEDWEKALSGIMSFAKGNGCAKIAGYTNEIVAKLALSLGFQSKYIYVTKEVL